MGGSLTSHIPNTRPCPGPLEATSRSCQTACISSYMAVRAGRDISHRHVITRSPPRAGGLEWMLGPLLHRAARTTHAAPSPSQRAAALAAADAVAAAALASCASALAALAAERPEGLHRRRD